jgi:hypothetical protein
MRRRVVCCDAEREAQLIWTSRGTCAVVLVTVCQAKISAGCMNKLGNHLFELRSLCSSWLCNDDNLCSRMRLTKIRRCRVAPPSPLVTSVRLCVCARRRAIYRACVRECTTPAGGGARQESAREFIRVTAIKLTLKKTLIKAVAELRGH